MHNANANICIKDNTRIFLEKNLTNSEINSLDH